MEDFEDARGDIDGAAAVGDQVEAKPFIELQQNSVYKSGDKLFFVCSEKDVFILNDGSDYSRQLTDEEIEALNFKIVWNGPAAKVKFEANDKEAIEAILKILTNVNIMQPDEEYQSWIAASIISHLRGFLYEPILATQDCFYTTIVMSGDQRATGDYLWPSSVQTLAPVGLS